MDPRFRRDMTKVALVFSDGLAPGAGRGGTSPAWRALIYNICRELYSVFFQKSSQHIE